jgi:hypothetical protein
LTPDLPDNTAAALDELDAWDLMCHQGRPK